MIEVVILGQFVLNQIISEIEHVSESSQSGDSQLHTSFRYSLSRVAHLSGALAGALVCLAYSWGNTRGKGVKM